MYIVPRILDSNHGCQDVVWKGDYVEHGEAIAIMAYLVTKHLKIYQSVMNNSADLPTTF